MPEYDIQFKASAAKEFRKLTSDIKARIQTAINALKAEPRPAGAKKLAGIPNLYRIRTGDYRIIYEIDEDSQIITVTRVGHRRDAYK